MTCILAISDKKHSALFLSLREWGYEVEAMHTLPESKEILMSRKFDITFVELDLSDLSLFLQAIKETNNSFPIIGITGLSESKANRLLNENNIARSVFVNIVRMPLSVEDLVFVTEEALAQYPDIAVSEEKALAKKERQQQLINRRRILESQRLSGFISTHLKSNIFEE